MKEKLLILIGSIILCTAFSSCKPKDNSESKTNTAIKEEKENSKLKEE